MFLDWFTLAGFTAVVAVAGILVYLCRTSGCSK